MKYWKYLFYVIRHKWFVLVAGLKINRMVIDKIPLRRLFLHDISKLLPSEFFPYAEHFYGNKNQGIKHGRDSSGYYKPTDTGDDAFDFAWLLHQKRNPHHWQWWLLPEDDGGIKILSMMKKTNLDSTYLAEMVADWYGAGRAIQGSWQNARQWYNKNSCHMQLHTQTKEIVERLFDIIERNGGIK